MLVIFKTARNIKVISYKRQDVPFFILPIILLKRSPLFYNKAQDKKVWIEVTLYSSTESIYFRHLSLVRGESKLQGGVRGHKMLLKIKGLTSLLKTTTKELAASTPEGMGLIPGWGTEILSARWLSQKKEKKKKLGRQGRQFCLSR